MKNLTKIIFSTSVLFLLFSCDTNKKLNQENAEKPIKQLLSTFSGCSNGTLEIKSIGPVSQFSENEASIIVYTTFNNQYVKWSWEFNCIYKKNMDKKWVLVSINMGTRDERDGSSCQSDFCNQLQNVNKIVQ